MIKILPLRAKTLVVNLCNWCYLNEDIPEALKLILLVLLWKIGDQTVLDNYRGISLQEILYKIPCAILNTRKAAMRLFSGVHSDSIGTGRSGRAAYLKAHLITCLISHAIRYKIIATYFISDNWKGFDSFNETAMVDTSKCMGFGESCTNFMINVNRGCKAMIRSPYGFTQKFKYAEGRLKQGDCGSTS